jgi:sulfate/thiosulfate transport system permease protein
MRGWFIKAPSVIPGFYPTLAVTFLYLSFVVLIPLSTLVLITSSIGFFEFFELVLDVRAYSALVVSLQSAILAGLINVIFGTICAWVLTRYRFPGRQFLDTIIDMTFALPTAVAGIALAALYVPTGSLGSILTPLGIEVAFTQLGIIVALVLVGLPFIIRTLQPVLEELDLTLEEAAASLGASRLQIICKVVFPRLIPALLTGFSLALSRGLGEYGSVIFIAGNIPFISEIAPLLIVVRLEEHNIPGATAIAVVMMILAFLILLMINLVQAWAQKRYGHA